MIENFNDPPSRRDVLIRTGGTIAAGLLGKVLKPDILGGIPPAEQPKLKPVEQQKQEEQTKREAEPKKADEKLEARRVEPLSENQEANVKYVLDRAFSKWDTVGRVAFLEAQNGAFAENYRQFAILHIYGARYARLTSDDEILEARKALLESPEFKLSIMKKLKEKGFLKKNMSTEKARKKDESYGTFYYGLENALKELQWRPAKPELVQWDKLSDIQLEELASRINIYTKYNDSSREGVSFIGSVEIR